MEGCGQWFGGSFDQQSVVVPRINVPLTAQQFMHLQDMHSPHTYSDESGLNIFLNVRQYSAPCRFDPPSLNIHCEGVIGPRNFKLGGVIEKSYGFTFVGPVSMETLLTFEPEVLLKSQKIYFFPRFHFFS